MPVPKEKAKELLCAQLEAIPPLRTLAPQSNEFNEWRSTTKSVLANLFGETSRQLTDFIKVSYLLRFAVSDTPNSEWVKAYLNGLDQAGSHLTAFLSEVSTFWPDTSEDAARKRPLGDEVKMKLLLSWSGPVSHEIAVFMKDWLQEVLPGCTPWVSSEDIQKGKAWWDELHGLLGEVKVAVIILTPENIRSPWLFYEAGAVATKFGNTAVCPYLVKVPVKLIQGTPFASLQCTEADKADTLRLVKSLHKELGSPHNVDLLEAGFNGVWPRLKAKLGRAVENLPEVEDEVKKTEPPLSQQLTAEAVRLLVATCCATTPREGIIVVSRTNRGCTIQAGDERFGGGPREEATWVGAVEELEQLGLIDTGPPRQVFKVTRRGWAVYDEVKPPSAGNVHIEGGAGSNAGSGGSIHIKGGDAGPSGNGGDVTIQGGRGG